MWRSAAARSASRVEAMPSMRSEWPEMNFVALCMTTSAPSSSGRWSSGVAKVASTATAAPAAWAPAIRRVELGDADERVGRALDPQQRRALDLAQDRLGVGHVRLDELDPPGGGALAQQHPHAGVADRRADHARAHRQRLEHGARRRHAGRERDRLAALQLADRRLQRRPGRRALLAGVAVGAVVGGEHDGGRERALGGPAGVDGDRVALHPSYPGSPGRTTRATSPSTTTRGSIGTTSRPVAHSSNSLAEPNGASCSSVLMVGNTSRSSPRA